MIKDLLSTSDVAGICGMSRQTIHRWVRTGDLTGFRATQKSDWRIAKKDLVKFMINNNMPLDLLEKEEKIIILIVDDEIDLVSMICKGFQGEERFRIETAYSGFSAGVKLTESKPDIILLDIYLGDMDGRELLEHIRNTPELLNTHVIGMSGKFSADEIEPLLQLGFKAFLPKPFEIEEMKKVIYTVIDSKRVCVR